MLDWLDLVDVQFFEKFFNSMGIKYYQVIFGEDIKELEGEEVMVMGYLIFLDVFGEMYVLFKNFFLVCFFCGVVGFEIVVEFRVKVEYVCCY